MRRILLAAILLALAAPGVLAAPRPFIGAWEVCAGAAGAHGPQLSDCRPLAGRIDPQGRELWLRAPVRPRPPGDARPLTLYVAGVASWEAWFNGAPIGANGRPAGSASGERPGLYDAEAPLPPSAWRADGNLLVLHMSSFHGGLRLDAPMGWVWIDRAGLGPPLPLLAATFALAGALLAALFGFGAIYAQRRTGSSLTLAAMAGVAALQALIENLRSLAPYPYPLHVWRLSAILVLSALFSLLLVNHAAARFLPRRRRLLLGATLAVVVLATFLPGFDHKSGAALLGAAALAGVAAAFGIRDGRPGAWMALSCVAAFGMLGLAAPLLLLDFSVFLFAAALTLPLLVTEVVRLGRDDRAREAALTRAASRPDRLTVTSARGVELVPLREIVAILGADDYAELRLEGGRSLLHAARLERLEAELPPAFVRVHRSAIANLARVKRLERDGHRWRLAMDEGPALLVSRGRLPALREALDEPLLVSRQGLTAAA